MSDLFERIERTVDAMAALARYPHLERHQVWLERLKVNLPELQAFESLHPAPEVGFLSQPPATLAAGGALVGEDDAGIAAIARAARSAPGRAADPAKAALADARRHAAFNAFIELADDTSLQAGAMAAVRRLQAGTPMPLLGVPVAIKDLMPIEGFRQTNGTGGIKALAAAHDAPAVARLREAGALVVGTTNLHELAYGITSDNPHFGRVVNPRATAHTPGGSSGGSAAAVAAGIVRVAIGTDTAGSIRIPAACCGVVGFKPSFDAIPRDGVQPLGASLDHIGPIAASVADAALAFSVMAGGPVRTARRVPLSGVRVGVSRKHFFEPLADDVARAVKAALERMRGDGAQLVELELPGVEHSAALQFVTLCSEATDLHWRRLTEHSETLGADVRVRLEIGQFLPAPWYARAQRGRTALAAMFAAAMRKVDVLVSPTLRVEPPRSGAGAATIGGLEIPLHTAMTALTMPFNLTGMPALTLPCGRGDNGVSIGLQIAGRRGDDWRVLDVGARLEDLIDTNI